MASWSRKGVGCWELCHLIQEDGFEDNCYIERRKEVEVLPLLSLRNTLLGCCKKI